MKTYNEVKDSQTMSLEEKAKWLVAECRDYMSIGDKVLIVYASDDVWLCESTSVDLDECEKIRRII